MEVVMINLSRAEADCRLCGKRGFLDSMPGLPMYEDEVLPDDYEGEWAGMPVCPGCYAKHRPTDAESAPVQEPDHG